jgi:hypothetical protein
MPTKSLELEPPSPEIRKGGQVVGITDRAYSITPPEVVIDDLLVRGDLRGVLDYNGHQIEVIGINTIIGLEVGPGGARGPVWKGVRCKVIQ